MSQRHEIGFHRVAQGNLELMISLSLATLVLGLWVCDVVSGPEKHLSSRPLPVAR